MYNNAMNWEQGKKRTKIVFKKFQIYTFTVTINKVNITLT